MATSKVEAMRLRIAALAPPEVRPAMLVLLRQMALRYQRKRGGGKVVGKVAAAAPDKERNKIKKAVKVLVAAPAKEQNKVKKAVPRGMRKSRRRLGLLRRPRQ